MTMLFQNRFTVPGGVDATMNRFRNVEAVTRCVPGASIEAKTGDNTYEGVMAIKFGPKRFRFKGFITCDFGESSGIIRGRGAADVKGARFQFEAAFEVQPCDGHPSGAPESTVNLRSEAQLSGMLADFARTGGMALANVMMNTFAQRFAEEFDLHPDLPGTDGDNAISTGSLIKGYFSGKIGSRN